MKIKVTLQTWTIFETFDGETLEDVWELTRRTVRSVDENEGTVTTIVSIEEVLKDA